MYAFCNGRWLVRQLSFQKLPHGMKPLEYAQQ